MVRYAQPIHGISNPFEPKAKIKLITSSPGLWLRFPTENGYEWYTDSNKKDFYRPTGSGEDWQEFNE